MAVDPLSIACPHCQSPVGASCLYTAGYAPFQVPPHAARFEATQREMERRAKLYPELVEALRGITAYLYKVSYNFSTSSEYLSAKEKYLACADVLAKAEGKEIENV